MMVVARCSCVFTPVEPISGNHAAALSLVSAPTHGLVKACHKSSSQVSDNRMIVGHSCTYKSSIPDSTPIRLFPPLCKCSARSKVDSHQLLSGFPLRRPCRRALCRCGVRIVTPTTTYRTYSKPFATSSAVGGGCLRYCLLQNSAPLPGF
ncbi:hypothetical protein OH76DRAFT_140309 [Lentinus brumalis]|uniref:Uncharacterized protein n=1 Tax=Lentinus brumalis TaxID=2498619 RepID=A0A371CPF8_9APHY|nr:hypothetical protein OH76DRAFT_140309 [Polyporus brumalis]